MPSVSGTVTLTINGATFTVPGYNYGSGVPANSVGNDGEYYVDQASSNLAIYGPKANGVWPSTPSGQMQGPTGPQGPGGGGSGFSTVGQAQITGPFSAGASWTQVTGLTKAITLSNASHGVRVRVTGVLSSNTAGQMAYARLTRDGNPIDLGAAADQRTQASSGMSPDDVNYDIDSFNIEFIDQPGDTNSHTYGLQITAQPAGSATAYIGQRGDDSDAVQFGRFPTTLTVEEVIVF